MYLISFLLSCFEQMDTQETNVSLEESNKFQEEVVSQSKQTLLDPFPEDLEELFFEPKEIFGRPPPVASSRFNSPASIAVDSISGDFYVGDTANRVVHRYDADGKFLKLWKCEPFTGIDIDPIDGSILVALVGKKQIIRYDKNGTILHFFDIIMEEGRRNHPMDLAIHSNGRIFVLDKSSTVTEYNRRGKIQKTWAALPKGKKIQQDILYQNQKYKTLSLSLSTDEKFLFVVNTSQHKIQKYTIDGEFVLEWGGDRESTLGKMRNSKGVAVNHHGEVIVADTDNERIQIFTSDGEYVRWFRGPHNEKEGVFHPRAVDVNVNTGKIYVAAEYSHRIDIFDAVGKYEKSIGGMNKEEDILNNAQNLTISPVHKQIYVSSKQDHVFRRFSMEGDPLKSYLFSVGDIPTVDVAWRYQSFAQFPSSFEFDIEGNFWAIRGGYHYPDDPTPAGMLRKYDSEGTFLMSVHHELFKGPLEGLDIHSKTGDLFITNNLKRNVIQLDQKGKLIRYFGAEILKKPSGIAIDEKRSRIYIADIAQDKIFVFSTDGEYIDSIGEKGHEAGELTFQTSVGLEVDDCGLLYIAEPKNRRTSVLSPSGEFKAFLIIDTTPPKRPRDIGVLGNSVYILAEDIIQEFERIGVDCLR